MKRGGNSRPCKVGVELDNRAHWSKIVGHNQTWVSETVHHYSAEGVLNTTVWRCSATRHYIRCYMVFPITALPTIRGSLLSLLELLEWLWPTVPTSYPATMILQMQFSFNSVRLTQDLTSQSGSVQEVKPSRFCPYWPSLWFLSNCFSFGSKWSILSSTQPNSYTIGSSVLQNYAVWSGSLPPPDDKEFIVSSLTSSGGTWYIKQGTSGYVYL